MTNEADGVWQMAGAKVLGSNGGGQSLTFTNAGLMRWTGGTSTLTVGDFIRFINTGTTEIRIGSATTSDRIAAAQATLGGTLSVLLTNGFNPTSYFGYSVVSYTERTGTFSFVDGHTLAVDVTYAANGVGCSCVNLTAGPKVAPTITWSNPVAITWGTALSGTQLNATANVPGTFVYTPPAGTVLEVGTNQTLSTAFVPTDTNHYTSANKSVLITVNPATQAVLTVTGAPPSAPYNGTFTVGTSGGSGTGDVTFTATGSCTNTSGGSLITMTSANGNCSITATKASDAHYLARTSAAVTVIATKAAQATLTVTGAPASAVYNDSFVVSSSGGSGTGNVTFAVSGGVCSRSVATVTMTSGTGTCSVTATKAADPNYFSATSAAVTVAAAKAPQAALTVAGAPASAPFNTTFNVGTAGGSGGGAQTFSTSGACTNTNAQIRMISATGTCSITATKAGNNNYLAATSPAVNVAAALGAPPQAPNGLNATANSSTQITLNWNDNSTFEDGFKIERSLIDQNSFAPLVTVAAGITTYVDNTGLAPLTRYYYRVRAFSASSTADSNYSNVANDTTLGPPAAPTGLSATAGAVGTINLSWTDNANTETGFRLLRSPDGVTFAPIGTVGINVKTYADQNLDPVTTYYYIVRSFNAQGDSPDSNTASATTVPLPPSAPLSLALTVISSSQINLAWTDTSSNESGFKIERSTDGTTFAVVFTTAANITTYQNTGLNQATLYYYRVRATNAGGDSSASNVSSATTLPTPPISPNQLQTTAASSSTINLAWNDRSNNETGFKIERSLDGTTFTEIFVAAANATSYSNTGLSPATRYYYRVRATNVGGDSNYSNTDNTTTLPLPPAPPSAVSFSNITQTTVTVRWQDNSNNETGFKVERSTDSATWSQVGATTGPNVVSFNDSGLSPSSVYYYRVRATNTGGDSQPSNAATLQTPPNPPSAPIKLYLITSGVNRAGLFWTDTSSNETNFKFERSTNGTNFTDIGFGNGPNTTSITDPGALGSAGGKTYWYRMRATNAGGDSAYSNVSSVTVFNSTPSSGPSAPSGLTGTAQTGGKVTLNWNDNSNNESVFLIRRYDPAVANYVAIASVGANQRTYQDTGLTAGTTYFYAITALNSTGNATSSVISVPAQ